MRVLKKILIGCGAFFVVLIALFAWLGMESVRFKRDEAPFVKAFVADLSRHWDVADVYDRSDNQFIDGAASVQGRRAIQSFKSLGSLTSIDDFELRNYEHGSWGRRAEFAFKASFENGEALVEIIVVNHGDSGSRVAGINLSSVQRSRVAAGRVST